MRDDASKLGVSEPTAYVVVGDWLPRMIPESEYRAAGYEPPFETLPTLDGVERAQETNAALSPDAHDDLSQRLRSAAQRREHLVGVGSGEGESSRGRSVRNRRCPRVK
jgi:hypothetical protein